MMVGVRFGMKPIYDGKFEEALEITENHPPHPLNNKKNTNVREEVCRICDIEINILGLFLTKKAKSLY